MKKRFYSFLAFTLSLFTLNALPGFNSYIQDQSGEYVYYKDNSFSRESYVGILCYDSGTYQIRYYAPANSENPAPKTVASLFTIDAKKDQFEMTGENVIIADYSDSEDIDIVNYMHDILYEFSKRRINAGEITPETENYVNNKSLKENGLTISSDYPQFGGNVYMIYDVMIPLFNLKRIEDSKGNPIFECVEIGKISSSDDSSFDKFTSIPEIGKVKINGKTEKKAKAEKVSWNNQKITLDENWEQKLDNMWTLDDRAVISLASYKASDSETSVLYAQNLILRMLLESKNDYVIEMAKSDVIYEKDGSFRLYSENYLPDSAKVYYGIKYLTLNAEKDFDFLSFAATKANYLLQRSYYDKIIKSYSN